MPQIFHPSANTLSRVTIYGAVVFAVAPVILSYLEGKTNEAAATPQATTAPSTPRRRSSLKKAVTSPGAR